MTQQTKIEWADCTVNFWEGCQKVGPGPRHRSENLRRIGTTPNLPHQISRTCALAAHVFTRSMECLQAPLHLYASPETAIVSSFAVRYRQCQRPRESQNIWKYMMSSEPFYQSHLPKYLFRNRLWQKLVDWFVLVETTNGLLSVLRDPTYVEITYQFLEHNFGSDTPARIETPPETAHLGHALIPVTRAKVLIEHVVSPWAKRDDTQEQNQ